MNHVSDGDHAYIYLRADEVDMPDKSPHQPPKAQGTSRMRIALQQHNMILSQRSDDETTTRNLKHIALNACGTRRSSYYTIQTFQFNVCSSS